MGFAHLCVLNDVLFLSGKSFKKADFFANLLFMTLKSPTFSSDNSRSVLTRLHISGLKSCKYFISAKEPQQELVTEYRAKQIVQQTVILIQSRREKDPNIAFHTRQNIHPSHYRISCNLLFGPK